MADMTKEERRLWLLERKKGIGGTDVGKILGASKYGTELSVWLDKTGVSPDEEEDNFAMWWGRESEENVAKWFTKTTGKKVRKVNNIVWSKTHKRCFVNLDRDVVGEDAILECKTAGDWKRKEWADDQIPTEYILQVWHQLAVTGCGKAYLCAVLGNGTPVIREINRTDMIDTVDGDQTFQVPLEHKLIDLENRVNDWYNEHIEIIDGVPTSKKIPDNISAADSDTLMEIYPSAIPASVVMIGTELDEKHFVLEATKSEIKSLEGTKKQLENEVKALIGENEAGQGNKIMAFWKDTACAGKFDKERFEIENPGVYEKYYTPGKTRKLTFKEIKTQEE